MSRQKYEGYATYSTYNGGDVKTPVNSTVTERFSNAPPPQNNPPPPQAYPSSPMIRTVSQPMNGPQNLYQKDPSPQMVQQGPQQMAPMSSGPPRQTQQQMAQQGGPPQQPQNEEESDNRPHRVRSIPADKLYELLANKSHFFVQNQQPLRLFIKVSTDWCKPCRKIQPEVKNISMNPRYSNILFVEVNGDELTQHEKLASKLRVSSVPSFFGFVAGQQVGFMTGINIDEITGLCDKISSV